MSEKDNRKERIVVTFKGPEVDALSRVTEAMSEPSKQSAIRSLVKREYNKRFAIPGYKQPSNNVPRETKADRKKRMWALPDEALTEELNTLGALEQYKAFPDDEVWIGPGPDGTRAVRVRSKQGGNDDSLPFATNWNMWERDKLV